MKMNLQILHLEDDDIDAEIIKNILKEERIECSITRASCKKEYFSKILQNDYDIIIADNSLPDYDGISALKYAREHKPKIPFIFVSGTIGEDRAVEALRYGARDYVLKRNLNKLAPAIKRIMHELEIELASIESEEKYRSFFENSMDAILLTIPNGNILSANPAACRMFEYSENELIKIDRTDIIDLTDHQLADFLSVRKLKGNALGELTFIRKGGKRFPGEVSSAIFKDHEGFERTSMIIRDITERKLAEETLRVNHERYKKSQKIGSVGSWEYDIENDSFWGSDEAKMIYGFNSETDIFSAEDVMKCVIERDSVNRALIDLIEKNEFYNIVFDIIPSNSLEKKTINSIAELSRGENGNQVKVTGVIQDITDKIHAEKALRESEEQFRSLYVNSTIGIYRTTPEGQILLANPALVNMLGYSSFEELAARNLEKDGFEPTYERKQFLEIIEINGEINDLESAWTRKDGTSVYMSERAKAIRDPKGKTLYYDGTIKDITEQKLAEQELLIANKELVFQNEEKEKRAAELIIANKELVFQNEEKEKRAAELIIANKELVFQNEEKEKRATELFFAKERAEQSDKLKSEFLAQMSHEIRTPINIIIGNIDYLNDSFNEKMDSDTRDCFDGIDLASKRIIRTVDLILNVAELKTSGYKPRFVKVDLNSEILNKLYQEHQLCAKQKEIEFIYTTKEKETKVIADQYSLTQTFDNLIDNAIKYTKKGKVEILLGKNSTGNIMVEIKDTGIGISKEFLPKLFEPFVQEVQGFSRTYDGNGLGLALVKKYCELNNAIIEVESEKNVGSTFRVIFDNKN
jgi:PAS domain S-box-containing protein